MNKISFDIIPNATLKKGDEIRDVITDVAGKRSPLYQIIEKNGFSKISKTKKIALIGEASFGKTTIIDDLCIQLMKKGEIYFRVSLFDFQKGKENIDDLLKKASGVKYAIIDGLDEVDFSYRQTAEEIVRKIEESGFSYIIVASRYLPTKEMGGFRTDFLNEYDVITLEPLGKDKINALAEKLSIKSTSFVYTLLSVPMYASMSMTIFAHYGAEIFDTITDEASYINTYFETLSLEKDKEFKIDRSGCSWDKIYKAAYETLRNKSFKKTDITIPVSINSLVSIVENGEGRCYLKCSSIRFLNFLAANHILNSFKTFDELGVLDSIRVENLLGFVFEQDSVECLRYAGELLRHEPQCERIIRALDAEEIKQDAEWYFNLCLVMFGYLPQVDDNVFALGNIFPVTYCKRIHENARIGSDYLFGCFEESNNHKSNWYSDIIDNAKSRYIVKSEEDGIVYFGSEHNPYECVIGAQKSIASADISSHSSFISYKALFHCSNLTSITIPGSVITIGGGAFSRCSGLTSITIPKGVINIGAASFLGCSDLTSISISNNLVSIGDCAFAGCSRLTSITIPGSVTTIGNYAFSDCDKLVNISVDEKNEYYKSVEGNLYSKDGKMFIKYASGKTNTAFAIPNGVTNIGDYVFSGCSNLTSITIPDSVTTIGKDAFSGCSSLTSITIPGSVTNIGNCAFAGCSSLTSITIPDSVTNIDYTFLGCSSLTSITIPDSVTNIGDYTFSGCSNLTSITIPDSVTNIGDYTFSGCSNLTSITFPDSVTTIGKDAFSGCSNLTSITIPDSVTNIDNCAFAGCSSLTNVTIPPSVTRVGKQAFERCRSLTDIMIPDSVTTIGNGAFSGCDKLVNISVDEKNKYYKSIEGNLYSKDGKILIKYAEGKTNTVFTIPSEVEVIGVSAIENCEKLEKIMMPDSITSIGESALFGCSSLTSITLPSSVTTIGGGAFSRCSGLTSITIPDGVTSIGGYAFFYCSSLTSIKIPSSVTTIGGGAFECCSGLKRITIPEGVKRISGRAFSHCSNLASITIPSSVTTIGNGAFSGSDKLVNISVDEKNKYYKSIEGNLYSKDGKTLIKYAGGKTNTAFAIPDVVTNVSAKAFKGAFSLTNIRIHSNVTTIENKAFSNCVSLINIMIPEGVTDIGECAFLGCTNLVNIKLPASLTFMGSSALCDCTSLKHIEIPSDVNNIANDLFKNCTSLESIVIPDSVTSIKLSSIDNCPNLKAIYYKGKRKRNESNSKKIGSAIVYYFSEEQPANSGDYWHYVNGVPTIWNFEQ